MGDHMIGGLDSFTARLAALKWRTSGELLEAAHQVGLEEGKVIWSSGEMSMLLEGWE